MTEKEKKLREILGMAIGEASMCWDPIPAGVFDSEKAVIVLENLFLELIKAFPQITKKPVKIVKIPSSNGLFGIKFDEVNGSGNERQAWIDSHFCEVVE